MSVEGGLESPPFLIRESWKLQATRFHSVPFHGRFWHRQRHLEVRGKPGESRDQHIVTSPQLNSDGQFLSRHSKISRSDASILRHGKRYGRGCQKKEDQNTLPHMIVC
jgi:hypothetical protein